MRIVIEIDDDGGPDGARRHGGNGGRRLGDRRRSGGRVTPRRRGSNVRGHRRRARARPVGRWHRLVRPIHAIGPVHATQTPVCSVLR